MTTEGSLHIHELDVLRSRALGGDGYEIRVAQSDPDYDIAEMDVSRYLKNPVVLWNHDRGQLPIGRTKTLERNSDGSWDAQFEFNPHNPFAQQIKKSYDAGYINGASIAFLLPKGGKPARLVEWSLVMVPADEDALRRKTLELVGGIVNSEHPEARNAQEAAGMTTTSTGDIDAAVRKALDERLSSPTFNREELHETITKAVAAAVQPAVDTALAQRDEAIRQKTQAEQEASRAEAEVVKRSEARAQLLVDTANMLPADFTAAGKTDREILVAALGDRIGGDIESKSDDYLLARLEFEKESRVAGAAMQSQQARQSAVQRDASPLDMSKRTNMGNIVSLLNDRPAAELRVTGSGVLANN